MNIDTRGTDWMARKACIEDDIDPEAFFASNDNRESHQLAEYAKEVCGRCLVRNECAEYALTNRIEFGIWGGIDERERRKMLRGTPAPTRPNAPTLAETCGTYAGVGRHRRLLERFCDECRDARNDYEGTRKRDRRRAAREERESA